MQRTLSFGASPPLGVPLRFFLTAPVFALCAAALLLWQGEAALTTRWSPYTLALTHFITLGFLAMCMIGALLQMLPVVLGIEVSHPARVAAGVHLLLALGTILLCSAFLTSAPSLFRLSLPVLLAAFGLLLLVGWRGVWKRTQSSAMLVAIRLALAALLVTITLGAAAAGTFGWKLNLPLVLIADLHAAWGLVGWVCLLVAGVAYQVIPMFQVTPVYPKWMTRWLAGALFVLLALLTIARVANQPGRAILAGLLACGLLAFSLVTLYLLWQRKRPQPDPTTRFWRTALTCLCAACMLWLFPPAALHASGTWPLLPAMLFIAGFAVSAVNGMLYKIVPFLVWHHLQQALDAGCVKAPNVRQILPDALALRQLRAHQASLCLLIAATVWPQWLARPAGIALAISAALLWHNLWRAANLYRKVLAILPRRSSASASR